jgi:uncharacterized protein (DUF885 family)
MHPILRAACFCLAVLILPSCKPKPPRFSTIAEEFVFNSLTFSPSQATAVGYHMHNGVPLDELLDDFSSQRQNRERTYYARFQAGLRRDITPGKLTPDDLADYTLLKQSLALGQFELEDAQTLSHAPQAYAEAIGNSLFVPYAQNYASRDKRFFHILKRLERIPTRVLQAKANLTAIPPIWRDVARQENEGNIALIQMLQKERPEQVSKKFDEAAAQAITALKEFNAYLAAWPAAKDSDWRLGPAKYKKKFQLALGENQTPEDLLKAAEAELQRTREEMARLCGWTGKGDLNPIVKKRLDEIAAKHSTREQYFDQARADLAEATAFVKQKNLLTLPPNGNLRVIETPAFMRGIYSVGGFNPAPAMEPTLGAQYWLTPIPADWSADRVESKLREYNNFGLKLLTIHEAMPGHYVQFESANRIEPRGRKLLRSVFANGASAEGWAIYSTQMMLEEGFLNNSPDLKITFLKQQLRMIANAIIDIKLHTQGMSDEDALRLMLDQTFQEKEEAAGKLIRAKLSSVQLTTYFAGWRDHIRMREIARQAKGSAFQLNEYHDAVLKAGGLPNAAICKLVTGQELRF